MTNTNDRGSAAARRARKLWLLETYRADCDVFTHWGTQKLEKLKPVALGHGIPACRCYRCGRLLIFETLTVDRIIPGCKGGTYRRTNIRPSCSPCATKTGNELKASLKL